MSELDTQVLERARQVKLLALDVDGVLTDGRLYFDSRGVELKAFNTSDGLGLRAVQRYGIELAIISGRASPMVTERAASLDIKHVYQGTDDKLSAFRELLEKTGRNASEVCYAGDDWIDLPVLLRVGLAVSVPNADLEVRSRVHWVTERAGGEGAVREICRLLLDAQGHSATLLEEYLSQ
jgi:3-deoxy-D-manno-octulosonate 8-phosphate phosphatase (KDO 8-P phosphatase)